ncbi:hypothetical protein V6N13_039466 [Hibiscus sabdariffa]
MFQNFMEGDVSDWICVNLHGGIQFVAITTDYELLFSTIIMYLWLSKNSTAFDNPQNRYGSIMNRNRQLQVLTKKAIDDNDYTVYCVKVLLNKDVIP